MNTTARDAEPDTAKNQLIESLRTAHDRGEHPTVQRGADLSHADLRGMDLHGADLSGADLSNADLSGANLSGADLRYANLQNANLQSTNLRNTDLLGASLRSADLSSADLRSADLQHTDLWHADLSGTSLRRANLHYAHLRHATLLASDLLGADLRGTNLVDVNLRGAKGGILQVTGLHPYPAIMLPVVKGWQLQIGCWQGTTQELRDLIAQDQGWPEARGSQIAARRPLLAALADICDLHAANHSNALDAVITRWSNETEG